MLVVAFGALGGLLFDRIGRIEASWAHLYDSTWAGLALTVLGLVVWHFFLPVSAALVPFALLSVAALVVERRWFRPLLQIRSHLPITLGALALVVWTANHSLAGGGMDDYNYEFQAVRWFFDYPLVPGLANLHGRLGFNNSHHLLAALLSRGRWAGHVNHLVNGFVVALALVYVLVAMVRVIRRRPGPPETVPLFAAVLFAPTIGLVLFGIFGPAISTLKADVAVTAGVVILSCVFLRFACATPGTPEYRVSAATAILVGCLLVTVKLSAAAFCAVILCVVLFRVARDFRRTSAIDFFPRLPMFAAATGAVLVGGFLLRGVILSGYPLYPSSAFGLNVDWRVPPALVEADRVFIKTWAQLRPTYDMAQVTGQAWVRGWLHSLILTQKLSIILPLVLLVVIGQGLPSKESDPVPGMWGLAVLVGGSMLALLVWLTQAPAARFASVYFWIPLACAVVAVVVTGRRTEVGSRLVTVAVGCLGLAVFVIEMLLKYSRVEAIHHPGVLAVLVFGALWAIALLMAHHRPNVLLTLCVLLGLSQIGERVAAHALRGRLDEIAAMAWYNVHALPQEPVFWYTVRETDSGLTVYHTDATSFHTPIPNTRYFNRYLELRTPGDFRSGFRNPASASTEFGYTVDYVSLPSGGTEIVTPPRE